MTTGGPALPKTRLALAEDDSALADIFNRAHQHLAGHVTRSATDLSWRVRGQPGMSSDGAFLVEGEDGRPIGYAFIKENGDVIDFAVDPTADRKAAASALISACEDYANREGAARMRLNVPLGDQDVAEALSEAGLAAARPEARHYITAIDPGTLLQTLIDHLPDRPVRFDLWLTDSHPWQSSTTSIARSVAVDVEPEFIVEGDQRSLNDVILGGRSPWRALLMRKVRVIPASRAPRAVRLLRRVAIDEPWFYQLGDIL